MGTIEREPEVIDNLTSTSTIDALSANQGKVLDDKLTQSSVKVTKQTYTTDSNGMFVPNLPANAIIL